MNHAAAIGLVAAGSAVGGAGRYLLSVAAVSMGLPTRVGTLCANAVGCFVAGVLLGGVLRVRGADDAWRLLLFSGILGGLTTFSALSVECVDLFKHHRYGLGAAYLLGTLVVGLGGVVLGQVIGRAMA